MRVYTLAIEASDRFRSGSWEIAMRHIVRPIRFPPVATFVAVALTLAFTSGCGDTRGPAFSDPPTVAANPNPKVPLAAVVSFSADEPVTTVLEVSDGERTRTVTFGDQLPPERGLPVLWMRPDTRHEIRVTIRDAAGNETLCSEPLVFSTPPLPADPIEMPHYRINVSDPELMEPGITVVNVRRILRDRDLSRFFSLLLGIDREGEVVWSYRADERISDVEPLPNGHLLFLTTEFRAVEIDLLGNTIRSWYAAHRPQGADPGVPVDTLTFHHDVDLLPSDNLLILGSEVREVEGYAPYRLLERQGPFETARVMGDEIVEFTPDGAVRWRWNTFDHLPTARVAYDLFPRYWINRGFPDTWDWVHANGLYYDSRDDSILLSLRLQSAVLKIDRETGDIVWMLGDPTGWPEQYRNLLLRPIGEMRWFYQQHAPVITPGGTLLLFDNGNFGAFPPNPPVPLARTFTRAVEYEIDERERTVRQVWESESSGADGLVVSLAMGEADVLPSTGNVLLCYGSGGRHGDPRLTYSNVLLGTSWTMVREFTHTDPARVVWEFVIGDPDAGTTAEVGWSAYGAVRLPDLQSRPE